MLATHTNTDNVRSMRGEEILKQQGVVLSTAARVQNAKWSIDLRNKLWWKMMRELAARWQHDEELVSSCCL